MKRLASLALFALVVGFASALTGCGGGSSETVLPPPQLANGEENGARIVVTSTKFEHQVGKTQCPQKIGTVTITNVSRDEKLKFRIDKGPPPSEPKATSVSRTSGELAKGESITVDMTFLCSQTTDVSEQWILLVTDEKGNRVTDTALNVTGSVR
ncbi:MAG: hypothetical protein JNL38_29520 [Myxococcales bacterium]|jgi:hypothetical protein|nr:hypothetical protein [Myxococcales bacterium]